MATMTFNTRLKNRYDTLEAWNSANPVLLEGEIAVVEVSAAAENVNGEAVPAILLKVGDGESNFTALPFLSGYAADVYDWAKAAVKPEYKASEITGLADYISGKVQDTDTQYKLEQDTTDKHIIKLYSKVLNGDWVEAASITTADTVYDDTALVGRVSGLETKVGNETVSKQIDDKITALDLANTYEPKGKGAEEAGKVQSALDAYKTEVQGKLDLKADETTVEGIDGRVTTVEGQVATLQGGADTAGSVDYKIAQAVANIMENPDETMNSINELVTWCNDHAADALELSNKVSANEQDIAALEGLVGTTGVAAQIEAAISAALKIDGVDKYALAADLTAAIGRIAALEAKSHEHANKTELDKIATGDVAKWNAAQANAEATAAAALATARGELETEIAKKANDADLAAVAKTGDINDLIQKTGDYIILNGGKAASWT